VPTTIPANPDEPDANSQTRLFLTRKMKVSDFGNEAGQIPKMAHYNMNQSF